MKQFPIFLISAVTILWVSCSPPPPVPPPRFTPNPPYPPQPVDTNAPPIQNSDSYGTNSQFTPTAPNSAPATPQRPGDYPTAQRTTNPNQVLSPYEPYNIIDVEGFTSGQLARDPSNKKIFRVP